MQTFMTSSRLALPVHNFPSTAQSSCRSTGQLFHRSATRAMSQPGNTQVQLSKAAEARDAAFVDSFRRASCYVHGHKQTIVVVVLPLEVRGEVASFRYSAVSCTQRPIESDSTSCVLYILSIATSTGRMLQ